MEVPLLKTKKKAERLAQHVLDATDVFMPVPLSEATCFISQHVVVLVPLETLPLKLPPFLGKEVWLIFATAEPNEAAKWHFPRRTPKNLPSMGKCGMVRRGYVPQEDPTGNLITNLLEWMDQSGRTGFEDFAAFMASLPVGTTPAVIGALTRLMNVYYF